MMTQPAAAGASLSDVNDDDDDDSVTRLTVVFNALEHVHDGLDTVEQF